MLPLARWFMQGRGHALGFVLITLISSPVLWPNSILAAAALSLVFLRIGVRDGVMLWLWALLPATALAITVDSFMPLLLISAASLTSWILKKTASWPYTLMSLSACSLLAALGLEKLASDLLSPFVDAFNQFLEVWQQQLAQTELNGILPQTVGPTFVAGLFGTMLNVGTFVSLVLARSWQAKLYKPGEFQKEFHRLRLGKIEVMAAILLAGLFFQLGAQYLTWVWLALFPLLIAGIALFHAYALHKKMKTHWYFIFYLVLMIWDPLKVILAGLAVADCFIDFRSKFPKTTTDQDS
jgi:uncharacterized protein YybS (DUF2232 family)